ncbi:hypothetical protein, partial [Corynebacterium stationis]|uniref:hypothetical protein n=1 Tax=Corynebacterium stationis TaxID=1705 RepID=UPI00261C7D28
MNKERHWATRTCAAQMLIDIQTQNPKIPSPDFDSPDKQNFPEFLPLPWFPSTCPLASNNAEKSRDL